MACPGVDARVELNAAVQFIAKTFVKPEPFVHLQRKAIARGPRLGALPALKAIW